MKSKLLIALVLILTLSMGSALAESRHDKLVGAIKFHLSLNYHPNIIYDIYVESGEYTEAEWKPALEEALASARAEGYLPSGYSDDTRTASTAELGDSSTNIALLTGAAAVSAAGLVLARKKRAAC